MLISREIDQALGEVKQGRLRVDDGTELLYQTFGSGPAVIFANGIGVRYPGVVRQIAALRQRYQVVTWDYRGMGQSVMPDGGDVSMARQAADVAALIDGLKLNRPALIGWSMGVQVGLELLRLRSDSLCGFVALLGTYGRPFRNALPDLLAEGVERLVGLLHRLPAVAQGILDVGVMLPDLTHQLLSRLNFVGSNVDREVFAADMRCVAGADKVNYTRTMLELASHNAEDVLDLVNCPTLVIAAEHDFLTPPHVAREMAARIPNAAYQEIPGTHFALIEQASAVNDLLLNFLDQTSAAGS
ncbi:MAG: alpha/beta hydrolase [Deltaproteobacteria bacterium]|nr:alpha/beta hydrolase [Deltaproteobacteria bacterium]